MSLPNALGSNNSSVRQTQPRPSIETRMTKGNTKTRRKGTKHKSKAAADDLVLSSNSDTDLSLTTLDVSSPSDTELTSLRLDGSHKGISFRLTIQLVKRFKLRGPPRGYSGVLVPERCKRGQIFHTPKNSY